MDEIRAGIVGLGGFFRGTHLPCLRRIEGLRIVAACDISAQARAAAQTLLAEDVRLYDRLADLLADKRVNAAYVLTGPGAMAPIVTAVARAGLPIFCEKPPGLRSDQTQAMVAEIEAAGVPNLVAFNRRFAPCTLKVAEWLRQTGPATRIEVIFRRVFSRCPTDLTGSGIHAIDCALSLMGPVRRVAGAAAAPRPGEGFCHFHAMLEFASGASGAFCYDNRCAEPAEEYHISVVSPDTLTVELLSLWHVPPTRMRNPPAAFRRRLVYRAWTDSRAVFDDTDERFEPALDDPADDLLVGGGYLAEHQAFAAELRGGGPLGPTFAQTVHTMQVAEAIQAGQSRTF